jgi:hypothetical protein
MANRKIVLLHPPNLLEKNKAFRSESLIFSCENTLNQNNMLKINVMRSFLNRLRDRGWKNKNVRGVTDKDIQVLHRAERSIVCVENIVADASVDLEPQIEDLFHKLQEIILRTNAGEIFLPGGGDLEIPEFFLRFCHNREIKIHMVSIESYREVMNFN